MEEVKIMEKGLISMVTTKRIKKSLFPGSKDSPNFQIGPNQPITKTFFCIHSPSKDRDEASTARGTCC